MVKLSDGREITWDLSRIKIREYRQLFEAGQDDKESDEIIGRACGMTAEEVGDLTYLDYRRLAADFFASARQPVSQT